MTRDDEGPKEEYRKRITLGAPAKVLDRLDPRLQQVILNWGKRKHVDPVYEARAPGGVAVEVLAKLVDPDVPVSGLTRRRQYGTIVTGAVAIEDIERVRGDPNVAALKLAGKISRELDTSVEAAGASEAQLEQLTDTLGHGVDGAGVVVGVVDDGCDFAHPSFVSDANRSRLLAIWDQRQQGTPPEGFTYGREIKQQEIDHALGEDDPRAELGLEVSRGSHGTHVMDICAGNAGRIGGKNGVAPKADIVFVQLGSENVAGENNLGGANKLVEAVDYIFDKAAKLGKPAVVNVSLSMHGGPHDGTTPVEQAFDWLLLDAPGRAIVLAAGNARERRVHTGGTVPAGQSRRLSWTIFTNDLSNNELEVWYGGAHKNLSVRLHLPEFDVSLDPVPLGPGIPILVDGLEFGQIAHRAEDSCNGDNHVNIFLRKLTTLVPRGHDDAWEVELVNDGDEAVEFHAWIERDDDPRDNDLITNQSRFTRDADPAYSLGTIACGRLPVVVGSVGPAPQIEPAMSSGEGPTRADVSKPDVSAPGVEITAADAGSTGTVTKSGTSMAAPHVAGVIALMLQAAASRGRVPGIEQIREALTTSVRRRPGDQENTWNPRHGWGCVNAAEAIAKLVQQMDE